MVTQPPHPRKLTRKQTTAVAILAAVIVLAICGGCLNALGLVPDKPARPAADQGRATPSATHTPTPERTSPRPSPSASASPSRSSSSPPADGDDGPAGKDSGDKGHDDPPPPAPKTDPRFGTCKEAIAHGYGPYVKGEDPEYDWYQDRDNDGIVCERR